MQKNNGAQHYQKTSNLHRLVSVVLCLILMFSVCETTVFSLSRVRASNEPEITAGNAETREEIKTRLMKQIRDEGWDPYSANMTIDEFYALMELFDEGKLPLKSKTNPAAPVLGAPGFDEPGIEEPSTGNSGKYIPRTKFLFAGLGKYVRRDGSDDNDSPLEYDNNNGADDELNNYPAGLDPYTVGYMRPPISWDGIEITDTANNRVVLVSEGINDDDPAVAGNVIQGLFAKYTGYYVKQVTIDGANINVLGMIELEDRCIYYYLSAEDQNTQVSTTTLPDSAKFVIEYVPVEHQIKYEVKLEDDSDVTDIVPDDVVFFGKNSPTTDTWVNSIFTSRPNKTTDGAYSFDVFVPYGYELQILISIDMTVDIPYESKPDAASSFYVEIDHTGKKDAVHDAWINAYSDYLHSEGLITDNIWNHIEETKDSDGNVTLTWKDATDKQAHDAILERMAERINDFVEHNNGYPLGSYPQYTRYIGGFNILPEETVGPTDHTMNDTFYNYLVKADRTVTAVLKNQGPLTFDVSQILLKSDGASDRAGSATEDFAFKSTENYDAQYDYYDADYEYHKNGGSRNTSDDPLGGHGSDYPNFAPATGSWNWNNETGNLFKGKAQEMRYDAATGTYYYSWLFQTNSNSGGFYLDAFEVNGIPIKIPFYPKYNWNNSYVFQNNADLADEDHPYYTETTLADGSILRLEFLLGWGSGNPQRHYRVTVTGARSNVVVTGLNLMMGTGAPEFVTYNLVGVYSDQNGESETAPAIEYYSKNNAWTRKAQANVIVDSDNKGINYANGDNNDYYGANIRFKITTGYGNPYYMWTNRHGDVINDQSSVAANGTSNPIIPLSGVEDIEQGKAGALVDGKLSSRYIYEGDDGYYYLRVTTQESYRFALLHVVARTVKYTVRYTPEHSVGNETWNGFVMNPDSGKPELLKNSDVFELDFDSMPTYDHDPDICTLWEMAKVDGEVPASIQEIIHQYDDNDGPFYDLLFNTMATIASNSYGTIRPKDKTKNYTFVDWIVVGQDFKPIKDKNGNYIQFLGGAIDFTQYAKYSVKHTAFGSEDTDIHVLRLMPVWSRTENPFTYNVVLNWVDNLGQIHAENFSDYWDEVVTEKTVDGQVYVYLNKDAKPLLDWISNHPTYTFWNDVNNATDDKKVKDALNDYLKGGQNNYNQILNALLNKVFTDVNGKENPANDTFERMGSDIFKVTRDGGTISIWMYENKGGLIFHKDVQEEPFTTDDEFYFTVTQAKVGEGYTSALNGEYKAYPQFVYDEDGKPRDRTDEDAWLLKFENGEIVSIDGNEDVTYFTLKSGEGIALYVPDGQYTIAELGSKSGGSYKVKVKYEASDGSAIPDESWDIPDDENLWLKGNSTEYIDTNAPGFPGGVSQVAATVDFEIGENNVVQTLIFCNQTSSLSIEKKLGASNEDLDKLKNYQNTDFNFEVSLKLPDGYEPLLDSENSQYYFVTRIYSVANGSIVHGGTITMTKDVNDEMWKGTITLKAGQRAAIVMTVPEVGNINYQVKEIWNKSDWREDEWDAQSGKPSIFTEQWSNQSGIAEAGKTARAEVTNWYGEPPEVTYGYLVITEEGGDKNETFLYRITNNETGETLVVSVPGGGETYVYAPLGDYTVEEITDWAWRYDDGKCQNPQTNTKTATVTVTAENDRPESTVAVHADYINDPNDKAWLGGENRKRNHFGKSE